MITLEYEVSGIKCRDDIQVTKFKQLLPADPTIGRSKDLIQFFSDRGERVVAVADLRPYVKRKRKVKAAEVDDDV